MEKVEGENEKLMDKKDRFSSALKYVHRDGNHFERCALYWR